MALLKMAVWLLFCYKIIDLQQTDPILAALIADRMREIREAHNDTKEYVMHQTGLGISDYERRAKFPTLASISKFCKLYNIALEDFFRGIAYPKEVR